jgi:guanylate kinase
VDYYFLTLKEFQSKIEEKAFLEYEEVYSNTFYGTLTSEVDRLWADKKHIIFDVDVKGATSLKNYFGTQALAVFIKPPSLQTLITRLKGRATESSSDLRKRIARVKQELLFEQSFDKILINDILEVTLKEAEMMVDEFINSKN